MDSARRGALRQVPSPAVMPQFQQQSLRLLGMANAELRAFVAEELERNAFLDRTDAGVLGDAAPPPGTGRTAAAGRTGGGAAPAASGIPARLPAMPGGSRPAAAGVSADVDGIVQPDPSLRDHLIRQINADFRDRRERAIALGLVDLLDGNGRLEADPSAAAAALGCDGETLDAVLGKCRLLDPAGVFARSLEDCLAIQLDRRGRLDGAWRVLLGNLDLLAKRETARLCRLSGLGEPELLRRARELRSLDPRPGAAFGHHVAPAVVPDIVVDRAGGGWRIELRDDLLPALAVNRRLYARSRGRPGTDRDRAFIRDQLRAANWLVRALERRRATLLGVAGEFVSRQEAFLEHGPSHLKPLTLRTVAAAIGVHESTVGRAVANKHLATACGVFAMRPLFAGGLGPGGEHSAAAVRSRIRAIVEAETAAGVASDGRIAAILEEDGIRIARRTVAKYRDAMRIPRSGLRRRLRRAGEEPPSGGI